ncbi:TenA family protein [Rhodospirillum rubrum]|uniref:Transcriptional activator, TenA family n=1 Tax=Rhodospirillum rubrum (strain ATCC 11170 / ATH 1.1.1 / DSM 467 / LMG 4362 / NCIMB 8255 / S1) TaxID=269796 RepID=Q2RSS0_RHORT|nr:TenA family protein [Rhodospirillum rubrum]ABC22825.1 transcriptional activator, TenA family [Rhodospirillum rubrum ATCC 11170]AEO48549.1 TenA family transcription regulator [Rhodospirillum rubrum F11]MBK5954432.1 thiaminase II [Rhodospirillum rubrum]QXG78814.1 TenA family protein [Rhodospirillum rubrum]HAQ01507.1 thiaminase II [Rhodospirillum rubrum]
MKRYPGEAVPGLIPQDSLFARLRGACATEWQAYTGHAFVRQMGEGSLREECFRHYLGQDYLFLIQFARAYALAAYKAEALADLRTAGLGMAAILDEMRLHVSLCQRWGLGPADLEALPEARATIAYTRYVLDKGLAGDLLDLHVALSPCVVGYAEIALTLRQSLSEDHPYAEWIGEYAGEAYQGVARSAVATLDRLLVERGGIGRMPALIATFRQATRLEADFWQMGLTLSA